MSLVAKDSMKWVYLMAQKCEKIKLKKTFLEQNNIFAPVIRNIEKSLDNEDSEIVIFLPDCKLSDLHDLVKFLTYTNENKSLKVNCRLENLLSKLTSHEIDPEEVVNKVELPSEEWIQLANDLIRQEFPALSPPMPEPEESCDPEQFYPSPELSSPVQSCVSDFPEVKQRALAWLAPKIHNYKLIGKLSVDSLIKEMLPDAKRYSEDSPPSSVDFYIKWNNLEFNARGEKEYHAKDDAAISAINVLLNLQLKKYVHSTKTKFYNDVMKNIRLDEIVNKKPYKIYKTSFKLPFSGQILKGFGSSLLKAKEKTFYLASHQYLLNKNIDIENFNKRALVNFFNGEKWIDKSKLMEKESNKISDTLNKTFESVSSVDSSINNNNETKNDSTPVELSEKERERLKYSGLTWVKKNLRKHLYDKAKPDEMLHNFLPKAVLSVMRTNSTTICKVKYKNFNWIGEGANMKEAKENVVIKVLKEMFDIDLLPVNLPNSKEIKEKLEKAVKVKEKSRGFTATIYFEDKAYKLSLPYANAEIAKTQLVQSALRDIVNSRKAVTRMQNREMFSSFFVDKKSCLPDRVDFILHHFTFNEKVDGSRFEATNFLLDRYERTLLEEIDKMIEIAIEEDQYRATTLLNGKEISCVAKMRTKVRAALILAVVGKIEHLNNEIVLEKPENLVKEEEVDMFSSTSSLEMSVEESEIREDLQYYKERALELLRGDRLTRRRAKKLFISPAMVLNELLGEYEVNFTEYKKIDSFDHRVKVDFFGEIVEGKGHNEHVAKQDACKMVFVNVLDIDWDREVGQK